jgi:hypothetical protein
MWRTALSGASSLSPGPRLRAPSDSARPQRSRMPVQPIP